MFPCLNFRFFRIPASLERARTAPNITADGAARVAKFSVAHHARSCFATNAFDPTSPTLTWRRSKRTTTGRASCATQTFSGSTAHSTGRCATSWTSSWRRSRRSPWAPKTSWTIFWTRTCRCAARAGSASRSLSRFLPRSPSNGRPPWAAGSCWSSRQRKKSQFQRSLLSNNIDHRRHLWGSRSTGQRPARKTTRSSARPTSWGCSTTRTTRRRTWFRPPISHRRRLWCDPTGNV